MKLLGCCTRVRPQIPNYPLFRLDFKNVAFRLSYSRKMATGLMYVSSKPLDLHPNAPASIAMKNLMNETTRQLQMYDVIHNRMQTRPRGLALCLIDDFEKAKTQAAKLHSLPPQRKDSIDAENKAEAYDEALAEETPDTDSPELPPELQPVLQESGLPEPPEDESEIINDGYDVDFDALDLKNLPDYDPDMDPEKSFYTNDVINGWIMADQEECAKGAKIRLYETLDIPSDHPAGSYSEAHKESPMTRAFTPLPPSTLHQLIFPLTCSILTTSAQPPNLPNTLGKIGLRLLLYVTELRLYDNPRAVPTDQLLQTRRPFDSALACRTRIQRLVRRSCIEEEARRVRMAQERVGGSKGRIFPYQKSELENQIMQ